MNLFGSNHPEVFCKKDVLRNLAKFTGKHLCQSLLFKKVAGIKPSTLLNKRIWHRCFPVNFAKFLRTPFLVWTRIEQTKICESANQSYFV